MNINCNFQSFTDPIEQIERFRAADYIRDELDQTENAVNGLLLLGAGFTPLVPNVMSPEISARWLGQEKQRVDHYIEGVNADESEGLCLSYEQEYALEGKWCLEASESLVIDVDTGSTVCAISRHLRSVIEGLCDMGEVITLSNAASRLQNFAMVEECYQQVKKDYGCQWVEFLVKKITDCHDANLAFEDWLMDEDYIHLLNFAETECTNPNSVRQSLNDIERLFRPAGLRWRRAARCLTISQNNWLTFWQLHYDHGVKLLKRYSSSLSLQDLVTLKEAIHSSYQMIAIANQKSELSFEEMQVGVASYSCVSINGLCLYNIVDQNYVDAMNAGENMCNSVDATTAIDTFEVIKKARKSLKQLTELLSGSIETPLFSDHA